MDVDLGLLATINDRTSGYKRISNMPSLLKTVNAMVYRKKSRIANILFQSQKPTVFNENEPYMFRSSHFCRIIAHHYTFM